MTDAEGQLLFRFAGDLRQENEALRAENAWLRREIAFIALGLRRLSARADGALRARD
jgi:hypothetical protein